MKLPSDNIELLNIMGRRLDGTSAYYAALDSYYAGNQPASFLSPESLAALGNRLPTLTVNFCKLAVLSIVERMRIAGFRIDGADVADAAVWESWERCNFDRGSDQVHVDALVNGRSYVIVWADDEAGDPLLTAESPRQVTTITDPASGRVLAGVKRWTDQLDPDTGSGVQNAVLYLPERVLTYQTRTAQPGGSYVPFGGSWELLESLPNPIGAVPVVPLVNGYGRRVLGASEGESELTDLMPLVDALGKLLIDSMVTSEAYARPRRWVTGLEVQEDDDGNPINPFGTDASRFVQAEKPDAKFGQFEQADMSGYVDMITKLTEHIGAVSSLAPHYLGVTSNAPMSSDALRASEISLVSRVLGKQRLLNPAWSRVAALEVAVRTGRPVDSVKAEVLWAPAESRSPSQDSDEASKLVALGVPLPIVLQTVLGWGPELIAQVVDAQDRQAAQANVAALLAAPVQAPTQPVTPPVGEVA